MPTYRIAICTYNLKTTSEIEHLIKTICKNNNLYYNCEPYDTSKSLLSAIQQGNRYDFIYQEIEMPDLNGIETAKILRNLGQTSFLFLLSAYEQDFRSLFSVQPLAFLDIPIDEKIFFESFHNAIKQLHNSPDSFAFNFNKSIFRLPLNKIIYFESQLHSIYIHTTEHKFYMFYGKLDDVEKQLCGKSNCFLRTHKSYLVNYLHIQCLNKTNVLLDNNTVLPISPSRRITVNQLSLALSNLENENLL